MKIKTLLTMSLILALGAATAALATTANPSPASTGYTPLVIPIMGSYSGATTKTGVIKFKAPNGYRVVAANATARSSSGTSPTLKLRGKSGAYVNYSGSLTAGTVTDLSITSYVITDEVNHQIDLIVGGTSTPTWKDITLMLLLKRL